MVYYYQISTNSPNQTHTVCFNFSGTSFLHKVTACLTKKVFFLSKIKDHPTIPFLLTHPDRIRSKALVFIKHPLPVSGIWGGFVIRETSNRKSKKMGEGERFQLGTVGALSLSVVSSVSIVICNKALMSSLGFHFGKFKVFCFTTLFSTRYFGQTWHL